MCIRDSSNVSHELKTPLTSIQWSVANLKDGIYGPMMDKQVECIENLSKIVEHLQYMIKDLLDISLIEAGKMEVNLKKVFLKDAISDAVMLVDCSASDKEISINISGPDDLSVIADPERIVQILRNLLHNSIAYSDANKIINVSWNEKYINSQPGVETHVIDRGWGIPEEIQTSMFDRFFRGVPTGKEKGIGIGLNIVKNLIDLQNGALSFKSVVNQGTHFTLWLPSTFGEKNES